MLLPIINRDTSLPKKYTDSIATCVRLHTPRQINLDFTSSFRICGFQTLKERRGHPNTLMRRLSSLGLLHTTLALPSSTRGTTPGLDRTLRALMSRVQPGVAATSLGASRDRGPPVKSQLVDLVINGGFISLVFLTINKLTILI